MSGGPPLGTGFGAVLEESLGPCLVAPHCRPDPLTAGKRGGALSGRVDTRHPQASYPPDVDREAQYDALVAELTQAGLVEEYTTEDGQPGVRLTPEGEKVARQLAMTDEAGQDALMAALLGDD